MQKIPLRVFNIRTRMTSLMLEINLFFAVLIFCLLLHTNSVNVEPPIVINRYDDRIGRPDVQVSWSKEYTIPTGPYTIPTGPRWLKRAENLERGNEKKLRCEQMKG